MNIWLNEKQLSLIIEALDMLNHDYYDHHPEQKELDKIQDKIILTLIKIQEKRR